METKHPLPGNFLKKSTLWLAMAGLVILTPFSINNFIQERYLLGIGSMAIVVILAINAWSIRRGRYYHLMILLGLVPAILFFLALAIIKQGIVGIVWCYPAIISFYMILPERKAWIANVALLVITLPITWNIIDTPLAIRITATLLAVSAFSAIFTRVITDQQSNLEALAATDPLTGLFNRTLLQVSLEQAIQQTNRTGEPMTLITLDLDHFKTINDTLGHDAGDTVLQSVAGILHNRLRRIDKIFRLGGEEFLALLHGTDTGNSQQIAEELRKSVESLALFPDQSITVSIGVATFQPGEEWTTWMKRSDDNLYCAKQKGRNQVVA